MNTQEEGRIKALIDQLGTSLESRIDRWGTKLESRIDQLDGRVEAMHSGNKQEHAAMREEMKKLNELVATRAQGWDAWVQSHDELRARVRNLERNAPAA